MRARIAAIGCVVLASMFASAVLVKAFPRSVSSASVGPANAANISTPALVGEGVIS